VGPQRHTVIITEYDLPRQTIDRMTIGRRRRLVHELR
jgi:hypothetical protein